METIICISAKCITFFIILNLCSYHNFYKKSEKKFIKVSGLHFYVYIYIMETIKRIKNILTLVSNVLKTPALVYHELCHLLMCLLTRTKVSDITVERTETFNKDFSYEVQIYTVATSYTKNLLISIAPIFGTIIIYLVCLYTESLLLLTYCFFSGSVFMPSEEDYQSINAFKSDDELLAEYEDFE